ncbi:uncharacterized protein LOC128883000 isoform X2 [Hylaeus volcanicus]|uniref:uncharacterized protein LOC128883000 isoform X2 n=1 Tax=Hylaeus volcanicus TaxID=313075 RepID=UPI0023B7AF40|nr:uncharacterized protein LOC128883000 isoform X2 [Hylaeus volcanicus]
MLHIMSNEADYTFDSGNTVSIHPSSLYARRNQKFTLAKRRYKYCTKLVFILISLILSAFVLWFHTRSTQSFDRFVREFTLKKEFVVLSEHDRGKINVSHNPALWHHDLLTNLVDRKTVNPVVHRKEDKEASSLFTHKNNERLSEEIFLSQYTKTDQDGKSTLTRDDDMCNRSASKEYQPDHCLGPPYLYITYHGGFNDAKRVKNICRYTRDGCGMGAVLYPNKLHTFHSLRGLILLKNGSLIATEAWKMNSRILRFGPCNPALLNRRELLDIALDKRTAPNSGILHPYGVTKTKDESYFYISAQGTSNVLRYFLKNATPAALPGSTVLQQRENAMLLNPLLLSNKSYLQKIEGQSEEQRNFYDGSFIMLDSDRLRGIAVDSLDNVYVANKNKGVMIFDRHGIYRATLPIKLPISLYYCQTRHSLWIGSSKNHNLYEYSIYSWKRLQKLKHPFIQHPSGMVSYKNSLFVISQKKNMLLRFSMNNGKLKDVVLNNLIDAGEHVVFSYC